MYCLRTIKYEDLEQLYDLCQKTSFGLTTLPADWDVLEKRVILAEKSINYNSNSPSGELYFFVLEDLQTKTLVGTSAIISKVGGFMPYYTYQLEEKNVYSSSIGIGVSHRVLKLVELHDGPTEIGSLFLDPEHRINANGKLLSLGRFLYMAEHRQRFENQIIAELRGVVDEEGYSPFWEAIGRHFFKVNFTEADYLSMTNKRFIEELLPKDPIYISTLPESAQEVIGRVHPKTIPAMKILANEGFQKNNQVDIFEGGPTMSANINSIKSVKESQSSEVGGMLLAKNSNTKAIVINTNVDMRAAVSHIQVIDDLVYLPSNILDLLEINLGDPIRYLIFQGGKS